MINRQKLIEAVEKEYYKFIDDDTEVAHNRAIYDVIEIIKDQPPADKCVPLSEVYRVIAGHSDYHGDNILAALTCIAEGKEVKPVRPLPADVPDTNVGKWIPVSEKLPDDFMSYEYLTIRKSRRSASITYYCVVNHKWYSNRKSTKEIDVIAWMPLPEPYKGE